VTTAVEPPLPTEVSVLEEAVASGRYRVSKLAEFFGISPRQLRRVFARHAGCSPEGWLREARLQAALRMLPTATSVKQVAYDLDFRHSAQFCRDFRARFGCTPSKYMQKPSLRAALEGQGGTPRPPGTLHSRSGRTTNSRSAHDEQPLSAR
jgi:AraC-like DNA-binding protein